MIQLILPGTSISVSRFVFGTASLHHLHEAEQLDLLCAAADAGITHFDTAPYYGFGLAERSLGRLLQLRPDLTVTTKVGLYSPTLRTNTRAEVLIRKTLGRAVPRLSLPTSDFDIRQAKASLDRSLSRLGRERVELLLLHEPQLSMIDADEWIGWLLDEKRWGRIAAFGLAGEREAVAPFVASSHSVAQLIQTRDSIEHREADFLLAAGRSLQLTFGYLANSTRQDAHQLLRSALHRNATGAVVVSTRQRHRLQTLQRLTSE